MLEKTSVSSGNEDILYHWEWDALSSIYSPSPPTTHVKSSRELFVRFSHSRGLKFPGGDTEKSLSFFLQSDRLRVSSGSALRAQEIFNWIPFEIESTCTEFYLSSFPIYHPKASNWIIFFLGFSEPNSHPQEVLGNYSLLLCLGKHFFSGLRRTWDVFLLTLRHAKKIFICPWLRQENLMKWYRTYIGGIFSSIKRKIGW